MIEQLLHATADAASPQADRHVQAWDAPPCNAITFRRFCVMPGSRQLLADDQPVELGGRAFDLLMVLLGARGQVVAKDEIVRQVWPSTTVDESNLRFQMTMLRKALGRDHDVIKTIKGRGYLFSFEPGGSSPASVGDLRLAEQTSSSPSPDAANPDARPSTGLVATSSRGMTPAVTADLAGRITELERENLRLRRTLSQLADDRLVLILPRNKTQIPERLLQAIAGAAR